MAASLCCSLLLVIWLSVVQALIQHSNGTKTFLYFGYTLANLKGGTKTNVNLAADDNLSNRTFPTIFTVDPAQPIVTLPENSSPNQVPFPFVFIPPSSGIDTRVTNPDAETFPPSADDPFPNAVRPVTSPEFSTAPTAPSFEQPPNRFPVVVSLPTAARATISPDTAAFPAFDTKPFPTAPSEPSLSSGVQARQPGTSLAQAFPQTVPLPSAPSAPGGPCGCVPAGTCLTRNLGGVINVRVVTQNPGVACAAGQQYCCTSNPTGLPQQDTCGFTSIIPGVFPAAGQANLGEFPWSGIIFGAANNQYIGGAVLVTNTHLLTVAHLVVNVPIQNLKIRLGDWDLSGVYEPVAFAEYAIASIVVHPQYVPVTLQNDIAVITLATPATLQAAPTPQVNTACLPGPGNIFTGYVCHVAGWGRNTWTGSLQNIIKKVDLTVLDNADCQTRLRTTKLGPNWNLDVNSFICAGGELAKDSCVGDGGNALVCEGGGRFFVAGITAGGVECGLSGIPGLYVNLVTYLDWVAQQTTPPVAGNIDPRRGVTSSG